MVWKLQIKCQREREIKMVTKNKFSQDDLDPEIIKIRDQIINKIGSKPLEEINSIVKQKTLII